MGPSGRFHSYIVILDCLGQVCIWVELPVQRRFCPIFVRDVGSTDIHECFHGLTGSQRTPGFWGVTELVKTRVVDMRSLISCMTWNIPYRITLFIWNMV